MKNILIVHHGRGRGGALVALLGLINELKKHNKIHVLCIFDSEAVEYIENLGVTVSIAKSKFYSKFYGIFVHSEASYFDVIDFLRNLKNLITYFFSKYVFAIKELTTLDSKFDIIYLNSTFISDWSLAAKKLKTNTLVHIREPLAKGILGIRRNIIKTSIKKYCDKIIAISVDNASRINLSDKTTIIYDPVVYNGRETLTELPSDPNFKYFLYLGGMQRIKGFEQFVKSLPILNENIKIYFLGSDFVFPKNKLKKIILFLDPYTWKINSLVKDLSKSNNIIKIGLVDNIFDYYNNSIALISPFSKPHASLPILEAFSIGKPVIVSDVVGMNEIVNNENGFFFKNGYAKDLGDTVNKMASIDNFEYQKKCQFAKRTFIEIKDKSKSVQSIIENI